MKRKTLAILALKVESFNSDCFIKDFVAHNPSSVVLLLNFKGVKFAHIPAKFKVRAQPVSFLCFRNSWLNYYLLPLRFVFDYLRISFLLFSICRQYSVKTLVIENTHLAVVGSLMRKFHLVKRMIYLPGDWLAGSKTKLGMWSYLGNEIIFPLCDYLACKGSDLVLDCTLAITVAREKFWRRKIYERGALLQDRLEIKSDLSNLSKKKKRIVFMGTVREDSGLEILAACLKEIQKKWGLTIRLIGSTHHRSQLLTEIMAEHQVKKEEMEILGFLERDQLKGALADCFCGVNLLTKEGSYTAKTIPAKIYDYLQYLLPVIVTENVGPIAETIRQNQLGLVIRPTEKDLQKAIEEIYSHQLKYRQNIIKYLKNFPGEGIREFLEG